jgi:hypothetical protein
MEQDVLGYRDGWLCAVSSDLDYQTPQRTEYYWPLVRTDRADWEPYLGQTLYYSATTHVYSLRVGVTWKEWCLPQGRQTQALHVEHVPVDKPARCRLPLRWHRGRWEKHTRKGWVAT